MVKFVFFADQGRHSKRIQLTFGTGT